jgi:Protein of unknown function (DUF3298)
LKIQLQELRAEWKRPHLKERQRMAQKERNEIPPEAAARVLFLSNRICCVCRERRKPVQIHHLDEDPSNSTEDNLAVLCLDCHHETQIKGGFARKLDAHQIVLYRDDWYAVVAGNRHAPNSPAEPTPFGVRSHPCVPEAKVQGKSTRLGYLKLTEQSEQHKYSFDAQYPLLTPEETIGAAEANLTLAAFITRELQRFRAGAIDTSALKRDMGTRLPESKWTWDSLSITHDVGIFSSNLLTVEFRMSSFFAGAVHSNLKTRTLNYSFDPSIPLEFSRLFRRDSGYIAVISQYCISALHHQQPESLKGSFTGESNDWILRGAGPEPRNFENFLIEAGGMRIFFDPYSVACYAEGRYEVFVPASVLATVMKESVLPLLQ